MSVEVYGTPHCIYCKRAVEYLTDSDIPYKYTTLTKELYKELFLEEDRPKTVPMVFVEGVYIGGYTELVAFLDN